MEKGLIHIHSNGEHSTKSGKSRYVPMTKRLRQEMTEYLDDSYNQSSIWIFHHQKRHGGRGVPGERIKSLRKAFGRARGKADMPMGFCTHDLRHRRATTWIAAGKSLAIVQKAMGHANISMTMKYTHLVPGDLLSLVA